MRPWEDRRHFLRQIYASNTPGIERKPVRFRKFGKLLKRDRAVREPIWTRVSFYKEGFCAIF